MGKTDFRPIWRPALPRVYGCPPLACDESLSSWIMQVAVTMRQPILEVLKYWNYRILSAYDADTSPHIPPLSAMASLTFESGTRLAKAHWSGDTILADRTYACLTGYNDGEPIHLYCPACLEQDDIPYLRLLWRISYQFVCEQHQCLLHDSCPNCRRRINYSRFGVDRPKLSIGLFFRHCPHCSFDLSLSSRIVPDADLLKRFLEAQRSLHKLVVAPFYTHPTAGTVASKKILHTFLLRNGSDEALSSGGLSYSGLNLRRLFLNYYSEVIAAYDQGQRRYLFNK